MAHEMTAFVVDRSRSGQIGDDLHEFCLRPCATSTGVHIAKRAERQREFGTANMWFPTVEYKHLSVPTRTGTRTASFGWRPSGTVLVQQKHKDGATNPHPRLNQAPPRHQTFQNP